MFNKKQRKTLTTGSPYQAQIILLSFFPTLIICLFMVCIVLFAQLGLVARGNIFSYGLVLAFSVLFTLGLIRVFILSRNLVGAFGRILNELDEVIARRSEKLITARPEDELANALLARINVLIKHYLEHKS